ncbi:MAG: phosphoglycerate mutase, partial [Spirochaetaceae bacterium]
EDWVFRCNIVTTRDGMMRDHSAENISQADAEKIIRLLDSELGGQDVKFYPGVSYRNTLVVSQEMSVETIPPHNILDQEWRKYLPNGKGADILTDLIEKSQKILAGNKINPLATSIWFWGEGRKPHLENFFGQRGVKGAAITAVDLVRGLAILAGWDVIDVPGATAYFDTNYKGKGEYAIKALENHDLVCVHVEAPDEAGHKGDAKEKIRALENIDTHVIGPILASLEHGKKSWSIMVLPDHPTPCTIRTHTHEPVIFAALASDMVLTRRDPPRLYTETSAVAAGFFVEKGYTLMDRFLAGKWK